MAAPFSKGTGQPRKSRKRRGLRSFLKNKAGNIGIMMGVMAIPVFGAAGAGMELSRAITVRSQLSEALDATGLAVARATGLSKSETEAFAEKFFKANYPTDAIGVPGTLSVVITDNKVTIKNSATVDTMLIGLLGLQQLTVNATAEITREAKGLEVALVLDNTGSMNSSGKIGALRVAATELVNILFGDGSDHLTVGLVPFVTAVNVRTPTAFQWSWIDQNAQADYHGDNFLHVNSDGTIDVARRVNHLDLFDSVNQPWKGCVEARPEPYDVQDIPPTSSDPDSKWVPYFWPDEPDCKSSACNRSEITSVPNEGEYHNRDFIDDRRFTNNSGTPRDWYDELAEFIEKKDGEDGAPIGWENFLDRLEIDGAHHEYRLRQAYVGRWNGTTYEGKYNLSPKIDEIAVDGATGTTGPNKSCARPIVELTNDKNLLLDEISKMAPNGGSGTNIAAGLAWGWRVLSPGEPFTQGKAYNDPDYQKAMIVLTDGENWIWGGWNSHNKSNYSSYSYLLEERLGAGVNSKSGAVTEINNKVKELCTAIKAKDIRLYTITFKVGGSVKPIFRNCATDPDLYYDSPSNEDLRKVFQAIAKDLSNLRISR